MFESRWWAKCFFFSSKRPYRVWGSPSLLLLSEYRGPFPEPGGRSVKLTNHLHVLPRLRMNVAVPLLPYVLVFEIIFISFESGYRGVSIPNTI